MEVQDQREFRARHEELILAPASVLFILQAITAAPLRYPFMTGSGQATKITGAKHRILPAATITAVIITFLLFFIDEGYFDLRWMKAAYNWFWFAVYVAGFVLLQYSGYLLLWWYKGEDKTLISCITGIVAGFVLLGAVMFALY